MELVGRLLPKTTSLTSLLPKTCKTIEMSSMFAHDMQFHGFSRSNLHKIASVEIAHSILQFRYKSLDWTCNLLSQFFFEFVIVTETSGGIESHVVVSWLRLCLTFKGFSRAEAAGCQKM